MNQKIKGFLSALCGLFVGCVIVYGGIYYFAHRSEYPWYVLPVGIAIGGPLLLMLSFIGQDSPQGGDMTSQHEGLGGCALIGLSWLIAGAITVGHFL